LLNEITSQLDFFTKFPGDGKNKLFGMAEHEIIPVNTLVFKQGEIGDMMYIIIRGCVVVEKESLEFGPVPLVVNTLFDGC
jgi:CRP-like cAMP-binding protein